MRGRILLITWFLGVVVLLGLDSYYLWCGRSITCIVPGYGVVTAAASLIAFVYSLFVGRQLLAVVRTWVIALAQFASGKWLLAVILTQR